MIQSVYEGIIVRGNWFVSVRLTPAYANGLALALPPRLWFQPLPTWGGRPRGSNMAVARPTEFNRADAKGQMAPSQGGPALLRPSPAGNSVTGASGDRAPAT